MVCTYPPAAINKDLLLRSAVFLKSSIEFAIAPVLKHLSPKTTRSVGPDLKPAILNTTFGSNLLRSAIIVSRKPLHINACSAG